MCTKCQVDWTSASSKTTLTKNFNQKQDRQKNRRTNEQTDEQTNRWTGTQIRKHNALYYCMWGIKTWKLGKF